MESPKLVPEYMAPIRVSDTLSEPKKACAFIYQ